MRSRHPLRSRLVMLGTVAALAGMGAWSWQLTSELAARDADVQRLAADKIELELERYRTDDEMLPPPADLAGLDLQRAAAASDLTTLRAELADADRRHVEALATLKRLSVDGDGRAPQANREVGQLSAALHRALEDRSASELEVQVLQARTAQLQSTLDGLNQELDATKEHFKTWVASHYGALRAVLKTSGVRVDPLVRQAEEMMAGEGGPFVPAPALDQHVLPSTLVPLPPELGADVRAVDVLSQLLAALPLGVPVLDADQRSGFGLRRDPFTGRRAMHTGLDFTPGSTGRAHATAPGIVVWAGRQGAYGKMVEIDHGFGLTTRFAHLSRIEVKAGERVGSGQEIGVIGSTGRSTGRHLHYEVRLDGEAVDPADFLEARKRLAHVVLEN